MKQLTNNLLKLNITGIEWDDIKKIEFAFAQNIGEAPLKTVSYPSDRAFEITDGLVGIPFTINETKLFKPGKPFYADARITLKNSDYHVETHIVNLMMYSTLFEN
jgi:hypothetical protein